MGRRGKRRVLGLAIVIVAVYVIPPLYRAILGNSSIINADIDNSILSGLAWGGVILFISSFFVKQTKPALKKDESKQ